MRGWVVASVEESIRQGRWVVDDTGPRASRNRLQTVTLLDAIAEHGFDSGCLAAGGETRKRPRAKERVFSFRDEFGQWDPKNQRPETVEPLQRPPQAGRAHPGVPHLQLDRAGRVAVCGPRRA